MRKVFKTIRKTTLHMTLLKLMRIHRKKTRSDFSKIGLTQGQPKILDFLVENDGCIQREIAESCNIEPATVTSLLFNMEKSELICRRNNPTNRRILNVFLTDKGKTTQKEVERVFNLIDDQCFQGFSEEDKIQALNILNKFCANLTRNDTDNDKIT